MRSAPASIARPMSPTRRRSRRCSPRWSQTHGPIHGVPGALFRSYDYTGMAACLAPKASSSTVAACTAPAEEDLDFFVLFSPAGDLEKAISARRWGYAAGILSTTSLLGTNVLHATSRIAGRRHGHIVALGWPLWREGRGVLSAEGEKITRASAVP